MIAKDNYLYFIFVSLTFVFLRKVIIEFLLYLHISVDTQSFFIFKSYISYKVEHDKLRAFTNKINCI